MSEVAEKFEPSALFGSKPGRSILRVPANETPAVKQRRLMTALFREYVKENPAEAAQIVKELAPEMLK